MGVVVNAMFLISSPEFLLSRCFQIDRVDFHKIILGILHI